MHTVYYISGPMTGLPNKNKEAFEEVESQVNDILSRYRGETYEIVNPANLELSSKDPTWEEYMRNDITHLMRCDAIVMMDGWEESKGARIEFMLATKLGMEILDRRLEDLYLPEEEEKQEEIILNSDKEDRSILDEAEELTNGARQSAYGHPSENFKNIADGWNWYIQMKYGNESKLTPEDTALMMTLLKVARETHSIKRDNIVDAAGYLNTYQMCIDKKNEGIVYFEV